MHKISFQIGRKNRQAYQIQNKIQKCLRNIQVRLPTFVPSYDRVVVNTASQGTIWYVTHWTG